MLSLVILSGKCTFQSLIPLFLFKYLAPVHLKTHQIQMILYLKDFVSNRQSESKVIFKHWRIDVGTLINSGWLGMFEGRWGKKRKRAQVLSESWYLTTCSPGALPVDRVLDHVSSSTQAIEVGTFPAYIPTWWHAPVLLRMFCFTAVLSSYKQSFYQLLRNGIHVWVLV